MCLLLCPITSEFYQCYSLPCPKRAGPGCWDYKSAPATNLFATTPHLTSLPLSPSLFHSACWTTRDQFAKKKRRTNKPKKINQQQKNQHQDPLFLHSKWPVSGSFSTPSQWHNSVMPRSPFPNPRDTQLSAPRK